MKSAKFVFVPVLGILLLLGACTASSNGVTTAPVVPVVSAKPDITLSSVVTQTPTPVDFVFSNLTVVPNTIRLFNTTNVSVTMTNKGTTAGSSTAVVNVKTDGSEVQTKIVPPSQTVILAPGESTTVSFSVEVMGNGTHIISIDSLEQRLTVDSSI